MKIKLIAQFICKSRDESFKPSYFMIRQCLSNKNENATVLESKKISDLNKAPDSIREENCYLARGVQI